MSTQDIVEIIESDFELIISLLGEKCEKQFILEALRIRNKLVKT